MGMNKVESVPEGHVMKNIHRNERMFYCLILRNTINNISVFEISEKCKKNCKDEH